MRTGVRLGVDVGSVRIGVAVSDADGLLATPVTVLRRDSRAARDLGELAALASERGAVEVVVGLPTTLAGRSGAAAEAAAAYAVQLARETGLPVRLVDERLSTVTASRAMLAGGTSTRRQRQRVDAAAAAVILQSALDEERSTGRPPGRLAVDTP